MARHRLTVWEQPVNDGIPRARTVEQMFEDSSRPSIDLHSEWLETDGLGGFASGTTAGVATRRYHALLLSAQNPPSSRFVLVNGFRAWLETPEGTVQLTRHHFAPGVLSEADARIERFSAEPWPHTCYVTNAGL